MFENLTDNKSRMVVIPSSHDGKRLLSTNIATKFLFDLLSVVGSSIQLPFLVLASNCNEDMSYNLPKILYMQTGHASNILLLQKS